MPVIFVGFFIAISFLFGLLTFVVEHDSHYSGPSYKSGAISFVICALLVSWLGISMLCPKESSFVQHCEIQSVKEGSSEIQVIAFRSDDDKMIIRNVNEIYGQIFEEKTTFIVTYYKPFYAGIMYIMPYSMTKEE